TGAEAAYLATEQFSIAEVALKLSSFAAEFQKFREFAIVKRNILCSGQRVREAFAFVREPHQLNRLLPLRLQLQLQFSLRRATNQPGCQQSCSENEPHDNEFERLHHFADSVGSIRRFSHASKFPSVWL